MMRDTHRIQTQLGEIPVADIKISMKSRDDIPQVLLGLQWIYTNALVRDAIFDLLDKEIQPKKNKNTGRPGMTHWEILVMGVLRLTLNWNFDALQEQVNQHATIRQMLGHSPFIMHEYALQTVKDNVQLLTPSLLEKINEIVVKAGHTLVKKKEDILKCRADSFVVKTHVHYPTDTNLLWDAMRKAVEYAAQASNVYELGGWRQIDYNLRQIKKSFRKTQLKSRPVSPDSAQTEQQKKRQELLNTTKKEAVELYLSTCQVYHLKVKSTLKQLRELPEEMSLTLLIQRIEIYQQHAQRQMDQVRRRILHGEKIPHQEKVFSLFQPHTEWIVKGKAGVPVELGVRVCIVEDHHQFILNHKVMSKQTDDDVAVPIIRDTKQRFPDMYSCSMDKGFHSPSNQVELNTLLDSVALPRKGKLSQQAKAVESSEEFIQAKNKHSAVESAINALEMHGLDVCPDHGLQGFERYVALAVLARNVQRIGAVLQRQEKERRGRRKRKLARQEERIPLAKAG